MDLKSIGKNKVGGATLLLLIVLLSQSKLFDLLIDTTLGRLVLILLIIVTSYTNKILGVVSVLMIIVMFNSNNILEGLEQMDPTKTDDATKTADTVEPVKDEDVKKAEEKKKLDDIKIEAAVNQDETIDLLKKELSTAIATQNLNKMEDKPAGVEGFDVLGTERSLQKGKPNCLNVDKMDRSCGFVLPVEGGSMFSSSYSAFNEKW